jgi:3-oxosteroid 1-dehydrogenase
MSKKGLQSRISRRDFLRAIGGGAAAAAFGAGSSFAVAQATADTRWDDEVDVVVVGTGGAAGAAAATAHHNGASVLVLEKSAAYGGTTGKSGGASWVPNHSQLAEHGVADLKEDALRYMIRVAYPAHYRADHPTFGVSQSLFDLTSAFYDHGPRAFDALAEMGAHRWQIRLSWDGQLTPDYYAHLPENRAPRGRTVGPITEDGQGAAGAEMVRQFRAYQENHGIPVMMGHRVTKLLLNSRREVVGVEATRRDESTLNVRALNGVIFGSGGFTHDPEMSSNYLRGKVYGGCAVPTNTGDLVRMAIDVGAKLGNMNEAWFQQEILEEVLEFSSVPSGVWFLTGDSMITVNRYGHRMYNEKFVYNERTRYHWEWDGIRGEYPNLFQFFLYDQRTAQVYPGGGGPIPPADSQAPFVIQGATWHELADNINERLASLEPQIGHFRLADDFIANLAQTIDRYNQFARDGKDLEYNRGEYPIDAHFHGPRRDGNDHPNPYMMPLADSGPYNCIILAPGTLDTKGGPVTNVHAQVLDVEEHPIPGLYAAGNCMASFSGQAYWGAGGTLGPALTFGFLAGEHASQSPIKDLA